MKKVKIYSTQDCAGCKKTKELFKENNVKFTEIDVGSNHEAVHEMIHKSGQMSVPVIEIDKEIIVGFDETKLRKSLDI